MRTSFVSILDNIHFQCSKTKGAHNTFCRWVAGCIDFETYAPAVCMIFPNSDSDVAKELLWFDAKQKKEKTFPNSKQVYYSE